MFWYLETMRELTYHLKVNACGVDASESQNLRPN